MVSLNKFTIQKSFAISAGAGSGKTYTLSRRYINAILGFDFFRENYSSQESFYNDLKPALVDEIVTITYTEAAALEMKTRIFGLIDKIVHFETLDSQDGDYNSIKEALDSISLNERVYTIKTLEESFRSSSHARISTIHSYCLNILKSNSDLAKIDTGLEIISEEDKTELFDQILLKVLNSNQNLVEDITCHIPLYFLKKIILKYSFDFNFRRSFKLFDNSISIDSYKNLIKSLFPLPEEFDVYDEIKDDLVRERWFKKYINNFNNFEAKLWRNVGVEKAPKLGVKNYPILDAIKKNLDSIVPIFSVIDDHKENIFFGVIDNIKSIVSMVKESYDSKLRARCQTDFDTIITKTHEIINRCNFSYKFIMVDEFQDTNEIQYSIIKKSMNNDTNLFVVGDSKQSIYSFQGAQLEVFNRAIKDKDTFSSIEDMSKNFRSDGVVLNKVNTIFSKILTSNENYEATPQDLKVGKSEREERGSFNFLVTPSEYQEENSEIDTLANFILSICDNKIEKYNHISQLIKNKKSAIAVLFDGGYKMLELKRKLRELGIIAKISKTDDFFSTKEVNDIFNVLKTVHYLSYAEANWSKKEKFFIAGALRSNILRYSDNEVREVLGSNSIPEKISEYIKVYRRSTLSELIKYIVDDSNLLGIYAHYDDLEQRIANINKFIKLAIEFQTSGSGKISDFLNTIKSAIYFKDTKEEEEFYLSNTGKSIEICTIHATKGLAYPMVILANSEKGLSSQSATENLKFNNIEIDGKDRTLVGFKIADYQPLSLRVLKKLDLLKHLAEKKRLLYVALTRAQHDVVISCNIGKKKDGAIRSCKNSYLEMVSEGLNLELESLFEGDYEECIKLPEEITPIGYSKVTYIDHSLQELSFTSKVRESATMGSSSSGNMNSAIVGTKVHKVIELYWDKFRDHEEAVLDQLELLNCDEKSKVSNAMNQFYRSDVYSFLNSGSEHYFEFEFNYQDSTGYIDLLFFDQTSNGWVIVDFKTGKETEEKTSKYLKQLDFYEHVLKENGIDVKNKKLLWL